MWPVPRELCAATLSAKPLSTTPSSSMTFDVVDVRQPRAAVLLGEGHAEHAQLAGALEGIDGKVLRFVPLREVRLDLALREIAHHLLDLQLLVGQTEIHSSQLLRWSDTEARRYRARRRRPCYLCTVVAQNRPPGAHSLRHASVALLAFARPSRDFRSSRSIRKTRAPSTTACRSGSSRSRSRSPRRVTITRDTATWTLTPARSALMEPLARRHRHRLRLRGPGARSA